MDSPSQGPPYSSVRQLFHSSHLPPPAQLHLPPVNASRSNVNTLPPLNSSSSRVSPYAHRHPSPSSSSSLPWPATLHRTSNSRDDALPVHHSHNVHPYNQPGPRPAESRQMKREQPPPPAPPPQAPVKDVDDNMPATCDFVKKLYKMLEDQSFAHVVSWGPNGDCFVVKDMNEFTKSILPRLFKHSNFASFVRQLNKYDFHKVKNTDDVQFGEHSWTFRHPDFHIDRRDALENIKRKVPTRKPAPNNVPSSLRSASSGSPGPPATGEVESLQAQTTTLASHTNALQGQATALQSQTNTLQSQTASLHAQSAALQTMSTGLQNSVSALQQQIASLQAQNDALRAQVGRSEERIRGLERSYRDVLGEMVNFQKNMAQQDALMQGLIQYFLGMDGVKHKDSMAPPTAGPSMLTGPSLVPQPKTPAVPPAPPTIAHSMTPSTHPPPSLFASGTGNAASAASSFFTNPQPQPSPFLQPLSITSPAPPPPPSSSSSLMQALGPTQGQSQASQGASQVSRSLGPRIQFLPAQEAQRVLGLGVHLDPSAIARASLVQMNEMSRRAESGFSFRPTRSSSSSGTADMTASSGQDALSRISQMHLQMHDPGPSTGDEPFIIPPDVWEPPAQTAHEGLQVFTLGHLLPRSNVEDSNGNWTFPEEEGGAGPSSGSTADAGDAVGGGEDEGYEKEESPGPEEVVQPTPTNPSSGSPSPPSSSTSSPSSTGGHRKLRVRRSTFVPGWAVPPRVLLVDDDAVSRRLSSKFLQVFGCAIDVAVDGVGAVAKMNLEKYDLVLMDIVMPKMDGISATSLIRQFDHMTPIISMTSNSKPSEIMTYYSSGMNDILPKPFTKQGLLDMLEKHLMHLKVIQQMSKLPKAVGVPPLSDAGFNEALAVGTTDSSSSTMQSYDDDGHINPLAAMGLSDERYQAILKDLVSNENLMGVGVPEEFAAFDSIGLDVGVGVGEKRGLEEAAAEMREGKRGRFELLD
ncbi:HSF-type DNA-binding-domain-containing protein [Boletus edulis]|nr:HSF-type DNA-binding-domain-containing protein [Boletus edulis]